jgi:D-sedoheptulose 7-phosphate isomerase
MKWRSASSADPKKKAGFGPLIRTQIASSIRTKERVLESLTPQIERAARIFIGALRKGNKLLFFGNGGSASDAQHLAAEFVGRYERERRALPAMAFTTDASILTAVSNDYAFETVFARQVEALGRRGDVAVAISTSGRSPNVLRAVERARKLGLRTIGLTGKDGGPLKGRVDVAIVVPSDMTSRIQEAHIMIGHILCDLVDRNLPPRP